MCIGARVPWNRMLGTESVSNASVSNTIACGLKALAFSLFSHQMCLRMWDLEDPVEWFEETRSLGMVLGINFFLWEAIDLVFSVRHNLATRDIVFHHLLYLCVTPIMLATPSPLRCHVGARLLLQETSSVPLNMAWVLRYRSSTIANLLYAVFALTFFVYRIVNMTHLLLWDSRVDLPHRVGMFPAYVLQWWWFGRIWRMMWRQREVGEKKHASMRHRA